MRIILWPDPRLKQVSAPVTPENLPPVEFFNEMHAVMKAAGGVGLSAIQVGVPIRAMVVDVGRGAEVILNPRILESVDEATPIEEGCLSTPGVFEPVRRHRHVRVWYQGVGDVEVGGMPPESFSQDTFGLRAQIFQHELEHMDGKMFVDHLKPADRSRVLGAMMKLKRGGRR